MDHTLGYSVGWGCGTGTCRHGGTHHCMNTPTYRYYLYNYINCAWCPQTSCCGQGVLSLHLCCFMPTSLHVYGCCFHVTSPLRDHCLALVRISSPYIQCWRYCSVKKLVVHQTPHEVVISFHSPQPSDQLLSYTHCRHCCTLSRGRGMERVCTEQ